MAKFPREEISYKRLYRKLDIEKDLGIGWPKVSHPSEVVIADEEKETFVGRQGIAFDEYDESFCASESIDKKLFVEIFQSLDQSFLSHIFKRIDSLKKFKSRSPCDVCGRFKLKDGQDLLTCQGCGISVHEECYGTAETPDSIWLCRKCIFHFEDGSCKFCQRQDGILKRTDTNEWGHVICALLNPGLTFCNANIRDPIDTVDLVSLEGICSICNISSSSLIKCSFESCQIAYHASCCAEVFYCDLNNKFTYCDNHNPLKKHKRILSKRNMLRFVDSYPEMNLNVLLRRPVKLTVPIKTKYCEIIATEPFVVEDSIRKSGNDENQIKLAKEYWIKKRKTFGFYFDDIFMFSNYLLSRNS